VVADIETSRLTLLRKWTSGWSKREQARVLAASSKLLHREAEALNSATEASQHQQITAHLIRGYQYASQDDDDKAFEEFEAATKVTADDIVSRDIAAGWARKLKRQRRELELLDELQRAASGRGEDLHIARALRRESELLEMRKLESDWVQARNRLNDARELLRPLVGEPEGKLELGRVLTLLCEVQCSRTVVGKRAGSLAGMRNCMTGVRMHSRAEEPEGEKYGEDRAVRVEQRAAELRGDAVAQGDNSDDH